MLWIIVIVVLVVLVGLFFLNTYNRLVKQRNRVDNAWGQVEVQLQRRYDLIPNLVETVKGYASHERATFERVAEARSAAGRASGPVEQAQADNILTSALRQLFAVAEDYPELRASDNFASLQSDLSDTENKIAVSRQIYNDTVFTYNTLVQQVPTNIVASLTGFRTRETYDAVDLADTAPEVSF
ncbi:MAG TPA: LemA family protein [Acidimicrobiia bacterium]|nr:LemA family protein [Acidimicrobiia bacterium]